MDNASREGAPAEASRRFSRIRVLPQDKNLGFAAACRKGAEASVSRHVVFLNDDAVPEENWLAALLASADRKPPDVTALAGRLTDRSGRQNDFVDGFLTFDGHAFADRVGAPVEPEPEGGERLFACGGNMLVEREAFFASGGFDDDYFAYFEDVDFGWRQWIFGNRVLFVPEASARHEGGATGEALGVFKRGFLIEKNAFATAYKNYEVETLRDVLPSLLATFLSRVSAMISRDPGAAELSRDPYAEPTRRGRWAQSLSRLFGICATEGIAVEDPLAIAQLRALRWIVENLESLQSKRSWIQARRRRSDGEIFAKFPAALVPTYPGDGFFGGSAFSEIRPRRLTLRERSLSDIFPGPK